MCTGLKLALAINFWLFNFCLVFVLSSFLPTHLTILNIFCKSTSLCVWYIYSLLTFTTKFKFFHWPQLWYSLFFAWLLIIPDSIASTSPNTCSTHLQSLHPANTQWPIPQCFLPAYSGTVVGCWNELLKDLLECLMTFFAAYMMSMMCSFISNGPSHFQWR